MTASANAGNTGKTEVPTVPGRLPLLGHTAAMPRQRLAFTSQSRNHGPVVQVYLGKLPLHVVITAELAHQVLTGDTDKFDKGIFVDKLRRAFGNGLVSTDGEFRRRQRRMIQPAFHRGPLTRYSETMTALAAELANSWRDGQVLELDRVMQDLAITAVGRTLFSTDFGPSVSAEIRAHTPALIRLGVIRALSPAALEKLPIPANRRFDRAVAHVHRVVDDVVDSARGDRDDLLSVLLNARDVSSGAAMDRQQVRDEAELRRYPLWLMLRRANTSVSLGDVRVPAGTEVGFSPHALHHDPRYYDDPARFDPNRWLPERAALPKGAYVPFAGGLHRCPGHAFAPLEIAIVAATLAARRRLVPVPGEPVRPKVTGLLYPNRLPMTAHHRRSAP
ncbi:cytochrome P450 [Actinosynnema sp. NPDC023794]